MAVTFGTNITNHLLDGLPKKHQGHLLDQCSPVQLNFGEILYYPGDICKYVYFPLTGFISMVIRTQDHKPLEVGMIGKEGMLGATLALGVEIVSGQSVVQGSGLALRLTARRFRQLLADSPALQRVAHRYVFFGLDQLAQAAACNAFHEVQARLAKWLLMAHDRSPADHLQLTHGFLADMLGVRRSAVSIAAGELQAQGYISYSRGQIRVLSRDGLKSVACECYQVGLSSYELLFPHHND